MGETLRMREKWTVAFCLTKRIQGGAVQRQREFLHEEKPSSSHKIFEAFKILNFQMRDHRAVLINSLMLFLLEFTVLF